jgi:hypothetical protein
MAYLSGVFFFFDLEHSFTTASMVIKAFRRILLFFFSDMLHGTEEMGLVWA